MNFKTLAAAAALTFAGSIASAATLNGELGLAGNAVIGTPPNFSETGSIAIVQDAGGPGNDAVVTRANGSFGFLAPFVDFVDFVSTIDFSLPSQTIFTGPGGLSFTVSDYTAFDNDGSDGDFGFASVGTFSLAGFDDTAGWLTLSTDGTTTTTTFSVNAAVPLPAGVLLMGTALAGFGVMRRKAKKVA